MRKDHLGHHAPVGRVNLAKNAQRSKTVKVRRVLFASTKKEPELTALLTKGAFCQKLPPGKSQN
jgi:hypothetical protein